MMLFGDIHLITLFTAFRKREPDQVQKAAVTIFAVKEEEGTLFCLYLKMMTAKFWVNVVLFLELLSIPVVTVCKLLKFVYMCC